MATDKSCEKKARRLTKKQREILEGGGRITAYKDDAGKTRFECEGEALKPKTIASLLQKNLIKIKSTDLAGLPYEYETINETIL